MGRLPVHRPSELVHPGEAEHGFDKVADHLLIEVQFLPRILRRPDLPLRGLDHGAGLDGEAFDRGRRRGEEDRRGERVDILPQECVPTPAHVVRIGPAEERLPELGAVVAALSGGYGDAIPRSFDVSPDGFARR